MIVEIGHEMLWGKDLQTLVKANIAMIKHRQFGSQIRVIYVVVWLGNELCGDRGIERLDQWGQRDPKGDFKQLMDWVKGNLVCWNSQLKDLGVDQVALVGEPDTLVYVLREHDFHHLCRESEGMVREGHWVSENERIRWIKNDKLPARLELSGYFHASESEENRSEMIGWVMSTFQLLHMNHWHFDPPDQPSSHGSA